MIEVRIFADNTEIARMELKNLYENSATPHASYTAKYSIHRGNGTVGMHTRVIYNFPRKKYNVFALVLQALHALNEKDLKLERDYDPDEAPVPADMARRLSRAMREIQGRVGRLRDH